ncbi:MAG: anthranilate phosphoribosyltransferase [Acidiferrobacteraceae bacterium]
MSDDNRIDLSAPPGSVMRAVLNRVATGPELSKNLSEPEATAAMNLVLDGRVDPVQAAVFLIALRMKRETDEENLGLLDALRAHTAELTAPVDEIVDIADPYDGYSRSLPPSPFLPAVLAAVGVPAVSHGVERVGPKYGITHRQVLHAAGASVGLTLKEAAERIANPRIGWAYVDQQMFCPELHALVGLRDLIVKRPALSTLETLLGPVRARRATHLVTGYVHKPYARLYALLARRAGFDSALIVRGVEGGVIPSLRQAGAFVSFHGDGQEQAFEISPLEHDIHQTVRAVPVPSSGPEAGGTDPSSASFDSAAAAALAARLGLEALRGAEGPTRDGLVYAGALVLRHLGRQESARAAADRIRRALDDGSAHCRFTGEG